ncbi:putative inactive serine/threonine-protein kinase bub1 [Canna indica]|uniref:Inactive serine/threonine-protein kinase bub1 n=1 Tax=Canna indica TaxID=4628 RepID=A0AAQ3QKM8_9LILI|nr:putative inactive serine/threonine-protein kinase bub1 [Canna indica]
MAKKEVDLGKISVNPDTRGGMMRYSTGGISSRGSSVSSTANEKPLPHYLRTSTSSCHDKCKYGHKHDSESDSKRPILQKSSDKALKKESRHVTKLNLEERRKTGAIKLKTSSNRKDEIHDIPAISKPKTIKATGTPEEPLDTKLQLPSLTQQSSISIGQEVPSTSATNVTRASNLGDKKKKQAINTKTLVKSSSFPYKHTPDKGIGAFPKSDTIRKNTPPLQESTLSTKPKLVKQASAKSYTAHYTSRNLKLMSSVPNEINKVDAKHVPCKRVRKTPSVVSGSPLASPREPVGHRKEKEKFISNREITPPPEKKVVLKPSIVSPSSKSTGDDILSLKQRKQKHRQEAASIKEQKIEKAEHDTGNNEEKALQVIDKIPEKVDLDSAEQKSLEMEKVLFDSTVQPPLKCGNSNSDSMQQKLPKLEDVDMPIQKKKMLELDNINLDSCELHPNDLNLLEQTNANTALVEQKVLNPENVDFDSLELKPDGFELLEQENNDIDSFEQNLLKPEQTDLESLEVEPSNLNLLRSENGDTEFPRQKLKSEDLDLDFLVPKHNEQELLEQENANMYSLEQKLLKPEDMDLESLKQKHNEWKLLEQQNFDINSLEQKLLKPMNIDLDSLELKSDDDQSSQLATDDDDDDEGVEESESASSASAEFEPEPEVKENKDDCEPLKSEERRRARRNSVVLLEDKTSTPHKLKFRRGKTIELQPESNGPRRLRFRRRRMVDASMDNAQIERKNFQRSEMIEAAPDSGQQAQNIMLKHQGKLEKKDAQGLFNNVIEETASKLAETRKSKVKALVGAFETVISLQDSKQESTA